MSDSKKNTQQVIEMAKFLNVFLTVEQVVSVEKMLAFGFSPVSIVRLIQNMNNPATQSPSNRENGI